MGPALRGEARKTRSQTCMLSVLPGEVSLSEFWKRPSWLSKLSQTSERDSMVFGFIIAYLGRPRRIIAHEDPMRREIYGRTRCNSPTETGRHSQINSGKRRHESGTFHARAYTYTRMHARTHICTCECAK